MILFISIALVFASCAPKVKPVQENTGKIEEEVSVFKYASSDLKGLINIPANIKVNKEDVSEVRSNEFSVNIYRAELEVIAEACTDTGAGSADPEITAETKAMTMKIIDAGDSKSYPLFLSHTMFFKFGEKKDTMTEYKDKMTVKDWQIVCDHDKNSGKGSISAVSGQIMVVMNFENYDFELCRSIFREMLSLNN